MTLDAAIMELVRTAVREALTDQLRAAIRNEIHSALEELHQPSVPHYLSVERAAEIAGVKPATLRKWVSDGDLRGHYAGRLLRIRLDELEAYMARPISRDNGADDERRIAELIGEACDRTDR